jgi:ABC-2 type transport system permease protein
VAIYKRNYRVYEGVRSPFNRRFLVLSRYAGDRLFSSRLLTGLFIICFVYPLVAAIFIYLHHNAKALEILRVPMDDLIAIDAGFFLVLLRVQAVLAFLMTALVGPGLLAPDLANNGLPLYLSRPLTRTGYVLGKASVLFILLSVITWLPGVMLFAFQGGLAGLSWTAGNLRIPVAMVLGASIWIITLSVLAVALSAWVKWRTVAGALLFGIFFVGAGFGTVANQILFTRWGYLLNLSELIMTVWRWLFFGEAAYRIPAWSAAACLMAIWGASILLLARKVRAYEVHS